MGPGQSARSLRQELGNRKGVPYEFTSPQRLLEDFFNEVDRVLEVSKS